MQTPNKLLVIYKPQTSNTLRHYFPYLLAYEQQKWVSGEPIPSLAVSLASVELRLHPIGRYPPLANCRRHGVSRPAKGAARGWLRTAPNLSTPPDLLVRGPCQPRGFALFTRPLGGGGPNDFLSVGGVRGIAGLAGQLIAEIFGLGWLELWPFVWRCEHG